MVSENEQIIGVIELQDIIKPGIQERFQRLRKMGIKTVMVTGDNPLTAKIHCQQSGVDDFIAEAKPEDKMNYIRKEQQEGRLVAMMGDGTNDAPALAQADVGVAMNSGTQAAKEAGNMVDLDNDPTKLIEVVEIGKQLLMTRAHSLRSALPTTWPNILPSCRHYSLHRSRYCRGSTSCTCTVLNRPYYPPSFSMRSSFPC